MSILGKEFYGNTIEDWLITGLVVLGALVAGRVAYWLFGRVAKRLAAKTKSRLDDIIIDMIEEPLSLVVALLGIWYGVARLNLSSAAREFGASATQFVVMLTITWMITRLFDALYKQYLVPIAEKTETDLDDQLLPIVRRGTKLIVWTIGTIVALNNAGYDVGAALAGLGIGGLALAMAGRDTVANMFGGLTIFTDQPFKLKDRVRVADFDGTIEEIGLRSTRLRTLEGRVVTIPNSQFSEACVENVTSEPGRKVSLTIGLTYDTAPAELEDAMAILADVARGTPGVDGEPSVAFVGFGDFAMNVLLVYWIHKEADILATQTAVNLAVLRRLNARRIEMAFPTQTLHVQTEN